MTARRPPMLEPPRDDARSERRGILGPDNTEQGRAMTVLFSPNRSRMAVHLWYTV
jgi:hypothetical protein